MYFCMTKSTKSHLRASLLEISLSFPALPKREQYTPSCANISSKPSDYRQRQKYRLKFTGCLLDFAPCHADTAGDHAFSSVSVQTSCPPATSFICEKYFMFHVLLHDQKYQKSSKRFPLRNLPVISHLPKRKHHNPPVRTYRANRPTACKGRSAGSNARVVCSTLLCAMPIYGRDSHFAKAALSASALSAYRLHARPPLLYMRAWNQRIRESARFFRVMCSHAWYRESHGERQT